MYLVGPAHTLMLGAAERLAPSNAEANEGPARSAPGAAAASALAKAMKPPGRRRACLPGSWAGRVGPRRHWAAVISQTGRRETGREGRSPGGPPAGPAPPPRPAQQLPAAGSGAPRAPATPGPRALRAGSRRPVSAQRARTPGAGPREPWEGDPDGRRSRVPSGAGGRALPAGSGSAGGGGGGGSPAPRRRGAPGGVPAAASEALAWASAQIHCQFHASESRVALPPPDSNQPEVQPESQTVFLPHRGERGQCILSTPPKILFCDLRLEPGESRSYSYSEVLPLEGPPSFRGQSVKYVYKLTIGCQRVNSPITLLRVPLRVLVLTGLQDIRFPQDESVAPSSPFLEEEESGKKDSWLMELAGERLMATTSCRSLHLYNISDGRGKVGTFGIFKSVYRLGEDVIGTLNLGEGTVACLQFSVSLQTEERVQPEYQRRRGAGGAPSVSHVTHARHQESCLHTTRTSFSLPIPLSSTPGFCTAIVSLKWRLHFEFVTSREPGLVLLPPMEQPEPVTWTGPEQVPVDTFSWDLPIKVLPTSPTLASYAAPGPSTSTITI
ncbi:RAB6A-GEF complex partner protein 2 isoform X1 [Sorex araneus]|uniref:RAB6A-GEF complex partner protein 2 isoform X1 n=1 Tax=Sorex araneus TaxID=42254 RepID=UPI002433BE6C|nr:RAB6A-GEF complex partner protein 2 isoform X1 [Sorex araneus]